MEHRTESIELENLFYNCKKQFELYWTTKLFVFIVNNGLVELSLFR